MSEHDDQCALFHWIEANKTRLPDLELVFAIPNGTRTTPVIARKMVAEGVRKGVPDVCIPSAHGGYHSMWIEMKSPGAYPRPEQRAWLEALRKHGHYAVCCHGWEEAAQLIESYLEGKITC